MWHVDTDLEDVSNTGRDLGIELSSMLELLDSEHSESDGVMADSTPLPCPCSETTLESHTSSSVSLIQSFDDSGVLKSNHLARSDVNLLRHIVKGVLVGSVLSVVFVAIAITYASNSTMKLAKVLNHRIRTDISSLPKRSIGEHPISFPYCQNRQRPVACRPDSRPARRTVEGNVQADPEFPRP